MHQGEQGPSGLSTWASSRAGIVSALTALALVILAFVATSGEPLVHTPTRGRDFPTYTPLTPPTRPTGAEPNGTAVPDSAGNSLLGTILVALAIAALLMVLALLAFVVYHAIQAILEGFRRRRRSVAAPMDVIAAVRNDASAQRQALREGTPSNAIIACWMRLEHAVAEAGVARRPSETSAELALRVLEELETDAHSVEHLSQLYREARFSRHPLTEEHREQAQQALDAIHAGLGAAAPEHDPDESS